MIKPTIAITMMMAIAATAIVIVKPDIVAKFDVETAVGKEETLYYHSAHEEFSV